jgi:hypothetical protein
MPAHPNGPLNQHQGSEGGCLVNRHELEEGHRKEVGFVQLFRHPRNCRSKTGTMTTKPPSNVTPLPPRGKPSSTHREPDEDLPAVRGPIMVDWGLPEWPGQYDEDMAFVAWLNDALGGQDGKRGLVGTPEVMEALRKRWDGMSPEERGKWPGP